MMTAKIFENGRSQAVRLPKEYRFTSDEVYINKIGNVVLLVPKDDPWKNTLASLDLFTDDCLSEPIEKLPVDDREILL